MASSSQDNEEDDYMSDAFIFKCQDTHPGLVSCQTKKAYKRLEKQKKADQLNKTVPKKVQEQERREQGLQRAIGVENKGFALLSKMGYKPGMAIGKRGIGRIEPVEINLKGGKGGLGREEHLKRKAEVASNMRTVMALKRQKIQQQQRQNFQQRMSCKMTEQKFERDLHKSQKVCEQLDSEKGIAEPVLYYFWPIRKSSSKRKSELTNDCDDDDLEAQKVLNQPSNSYLTTEDEVEEEDNELDDLIPNEEKLVCLTEYLRKTHVYCLWCGTAYDDEDDLNQNCPGDTAQAHDE